MQFVGCYISSLHLSAFFWLGRYDIQTFCIFFFFRFGSLIVGVASIHR